MENTSVNIASGTGVSVDVISTSDSDVRQVVVLGDSETESLIKVDPGTSAISVSSVNAISVNATVSGNVGVSGYDSADVKVTLDGETVPVTDNGGSLTVDGTVAVSNLPSEQAVIGNVGVSGYDSADVKVTLDGEAVPVTDNGGSLTVDDGGVGLRVDIREINNTSFAGGNLPVKLNSVGSLDASLPVPVGVPVTVSAVFAGTSTTNFSQLATVTSGQSIRVYGVMASSRETTSGILLEIAKTTGTPDTSVPSSDAFLYVSVPPKDSEGVNLNPNYISLSDNEDIYFRPIVIAPTGSNYVVLQLFYSIV